MEISNPNSLLKCPTCKLFFDDQEKHKQHYKSDFHRYNLKRSMVNLPPATLQQFSTKRAQVKNQRQATFQCGQCRKTFATAQTLNQHAVSKKHDINKIPQQRPQKLIDARPKVYVKNEKRCLFCVKQFATLELSLEHMRIDHSFFIGQQTYCIDKKGLILYLQQKIEVGMMCIFCDNKGAKDFATGEAVRKHMMSKSHMFMKTQNGYEEYENFYDFSELFREKIEQQRLYSNPLGINYQKVKVIVDDKNDKKQKEKMEEEETEMKEQEGDWENVDDEGDEEWEDESDEEDDEAIEQNQNQNSDDEGEMKEKKKRKIKTYQIMVPTLTSADELLLPNGVILGHRKYRHIYRQALKLNNWMQNSNKKMLQNGPSQHALVLRNNLLQLIRKDRVNKSFNRREDKNYVKEGIQNSNLFRHFRSSNPL